MDTKKIQHFIRNGSTNQTLATPDLRVLEGWKWSTLLSYNAAVKKFEDVYAFVTWAGRGVGDKGTTKINATSLKNYLFAIKAWHTFHDAPYPYQTEKQVNLMLKVSGRHDATIPKRPEKAPVLIADLADLFRLLLGRGPEAKAVRDLAVIAFWGMAQLAELTYTTDLGPVQRKREMTRKEVYTFQEVTILTVHEAKTAKPGETQAIKLQPMKSPLCPVDAVERRRGATTGDSNSLFGWDGPHGRINLTKRRATPLGWAEQLYATQ
ncbi:hypothetical protein PSTG_15979 [Puccinia striiformis f. sp. tritici PST-78]|uniref:Core-binding (CB) domain-containing protein n=1 Tax=Puccinia striiformis f. sp. tritici PST-78 TaxID=1165861 RepID=A0A0L0UUH6_9BASI|nr:hypothetical protein PSTG_15979 [Puccinia striiformis f. sp. tritici PST-78]